MTAPASPTVRRRRLAAELRGIREDKGKSGDAVAAALKWSPSKISRYERARTGLRPREVARLLDYYQITGPRRALLLGLAEDAAQKGWWDEFADSLSEDYQQFIGLEHEAASMAIWHVDVVTGLLQTEAYARHIIGSYSRVEPVAPGLIGRMVKVSDLVEEWIEMRSKLQRQLKMLESVELRIKKWIEARDRGCRGSSPCRDDRGRAPSQRSPARARGAAAPPRGRLGLAAESRS